MITQKQQQIKDLLADGKSVDDITAILGVTRSAVYGHIRKMRELGVELPDSVSAVGTRRNSGRGKSRPTTELGRRTKNAPNPGKLMEEFKERIAAERSAIEKRRTEIQEELDALKAMEADLTQYEKTLNKATTGKAA